jgi:oligosaccharide reducing-end xylanase
MARLWQCCRRRLAATQRLAIVVILLGTAALGAAACSNGNPTTGLTPDYANFDGTPKAASWDALTATFRYDAFRTVVNWSVDYAWNKKSKDEAALSNRLLSWFGAARASAPGSLYLLDGTSQGTNNALGLLACNAVGALAADAATAGPFVDALWNASPPTGTWRYYDGMLYFLAVLHVSGQFRDWTVK